MYNNRYNHKSDEKFFECIKYAHENGCPWDELTCKWAVTWGYINSLEYAVKNECPWNEETCECAAAFGNLECLQYAHENRCPWDIRTCSQAVINGNLECLQYAHENGCPWSTETCELAWENDNLKCLEYAHKNGCPYPQEVRSTIVKEILIPKWRDSVKIRPYILHWIEDTAKTLYAENKEGRKRDYDTFVEDFNNLIINKKLKI